MAVNYQTLHQARLENLLEWRELKQKSIFQKLFASEIHEVLLKLERMRGVWQPMRLGTLQNLSKLLEYVPQELLRALDRTSNFWDDIASLCGSQDYSFEDVEKMSGLWPKNSGIDRENFEASMTNNTLFPNITDTVVRNRIQEKVATMNCRVPTLSVIQAEASALHGAHDKGRLSGWIPYLSAGGAPAFHPPRPSLSTTILQPTCPRTHADSWRENDFQTSMSNTSDHLRYHGILAIPYGHWIMDIAQGQRHVKHQVIPRLVLQQGEQQQCGGSIRVI